MTGDVGEKYVDKVIELHENNEEIRDEVSSLIVWAITSEDPEEDDDDYLARISTNFDYAINQLRRAQAVVDNYRKG